jgi:outer membrane protein assembly factor BamB
MASFPALRRWVLTALAAAVFGAVCLLGAGHNPAPDAPRANAAPAPPPSWPMFGGGPGRNLENVSDKNIPAAWVLKPGAEKNVKWSQPLGSKAYGGPVIAGGKIFVGTNNNLPRNPDVTGDKGIVMCFKEDTGEFLWQYISDKLESGRVNDWPDEGIASSPVVEGDRLWLVTNRCEVVCLGTGGLAAGNWGVQDEKYKSKTDADVIWRLDMMAKFGVFPHNLAVCSPLIVGDALFVVTGNGVDELHRYAVAPEAPSFLALDKNTGKVLWKDNSPGKNIMHGQWSNPTFAEPNGKPQIIFPGGDGWLRAFDPKDGTLLWKFDCNPKDAFYELGPRATRNDFLGTPVVWENKLYVGVGQDPEHGVGVGHLWCIDITKEPKNADKDLSPAAKPPEKPGDKPQTIFDPKDPANKDSGLVWHFGGDVPDGVDYQGGRYYFGRTISTCCVHDGLVYAAEYAGYLHCLDARTGREYWVDDLKAQTWASPYYVDGKVFLGDERGKVRVYQPGKEKKVLAVNENIRHCKVEWGTPVAANGTLYLMTMDPCRLWAIADK